MGVVTGRVTTAASFANSLPDMKMERRKDGRTFKVLSEVEVAV